MRRRLIENITPMVPPTAAMTNTGKKAKSSHVPSTTSAGSVKMTPAASDSPAETAVWTQLFSRMLVSCRGRMAAIARSIPIESTAAGIEAETVIPT